MEYLLTICPNCGSGLDTGRFLLDECAKAKTVAANPVWCNGISLLGAGAWFWRAISGMARAVDRTLDGPSVLYLPRSERSAHIRILRPAYRRTALVSRQRFWEPRIDGADSTGGTPLLDRCMLSRR